MAAAGTGACHPQGAVAVAPHDLAVAREARLEVLPGVPGQWEAAVAGRLWVLPAYPGTNQGEACGPVESAVVFHWQEVRAFGLQALLEDGRQMAVDDGLLGLSEDGHLYLWEDGQSE